MRKKLVSQPEGCESYSRLKRPHESRLYYEIRLEVTAPKPIFTGVWIILEVRAGNGGKPTGTRIARTTRYSRDVEDHIESGWTVVSALFAKTRSQENRIFRTLRGTGRKKVRGLISKAAVFDAFARIYKLDLYTTFDRVFGFKCEHLIKRIVRKATSRPSTG
jgi:hypothetical protein